MSQAPDKLLPHQKEALSSLEKMQTGVVDQMSSRTFDVELGAGKTNALHKAGQKMVDTLIARHGKEGAQRILAQRLMEANGRRALSRYDPVYRAVRTVLYVPSTQDKVDHQIDLKIVRYFQRLQIKAALTQRLDKSEVESAMDGLAGVIESTGGDVDMSETDYLTQGVNGERLDESIKQLENGQVVECPVDRAFRVSAEQLSHLEEMETEQQEAAGDITYALPADTSEVDARQKCDVLCDKSNNSEHSDLEGNGGETPPMTTSGVDDMDLDDFDNLDVPETDIEYQKPDPNSDCGDACKI